MTLQEIQSIEIIINDEKKYFMDDGRHPYLRPYDDSMQ